MSNIFTRFCTGCGIHIAFIVVTVVLLIVLAFTEESAKAGGLVVGFILLAMSICSTICCWTCGTGGVSTMGWY